MEVFGFKSMSLGSMGFIFGIMCLRKIEKLTKTKTLKEKGILEGNYKEE